MFFRKRIFFTLDHLKDYHNDRNEMTQEFERLNTQNLCQTPDKVMTDLKSAKFFLEGLSNDELKVLDVNFKKNFK